MQNKTNIFFIYFLFFQVTKCLLRKKSREISPPWQKFGNFYLSYFWSRQAECAAFFLSRIYFLISLFQVSLLYLILYTRLCELYINCCDIATVNYDINEEGLTDRLALCEHHFV